MEPSPTNILIVEDQPSTRDWLLTAAQSAFPEATVRLAGSAAEALAEIEQPVDLVLLDLGLPDSPGLRVLHQLRLRQPQARCVIATIFDDDEHLFAALKLGAAGYILKDQSREQLGEMLQAMLAGQPPLSPSIARRLLSHFVAPVAPLPSVAANDSLTEREREVLLLVSKGYSVPQAAKAMAISPHTAHTHIKGVYRKLAVASRAEAVLAANRLGLV